MKEPLWLSTARMTEGISEISGLASNPIILKWAREIGAPPFFDNDDIAWCAVFASRLALAHQFPLPGSGFDLLRARSFLTWGQRLQSPVLGAWGVFDRPGGAHVGLYCGERLDAYYVLGGNTGNSVASTWIAKARLLDWRWPSGVPIAGFTPIALHNDGRPVSTNEV